MAQLQQNQPGGETTSTASEFESLLQREFKPKTDSVKSEVENAVKTLAGQALAHTQLISEDTVQTVRSMIAEIDRKLSDQINQIMHHEEFQKLEGAWRGLHHLVNNTESDAQLKIRVMNISKRELHKTLKAYKGTAWDQSPLFKRLYEEEYGTLGGEPYGCMIGDYYFDHSAPDVELLGEMSKISAAMHAPFLSAADPSLFLMESWQELSNPRDLSTLFTTAEHAAWRSLRESEEARYLGLTLPRVLGRAPYGAKSDPVDEF
ncbi:MAG: type secretion system contractile sheath large subunit, partial [Pseudomonadota bacterium]